VADSGVASKVAGVLNALSIFASTPDMEENAFMVKVLTGTLDTIAWQSVQWGYDGIELLPNPEDVPRSAEVERAVSAAGACVTVINSGRLYAQGMALLHRDVSARRRALEAFERLIDLGAALGVPVGLGAARGARAVCVAAREAEVVSRGVFEAIAAYAESVGGLVMLEPADSGEIPSVPTVAEAVAWVERIGSPSLTIMLDTYQIATREESFEQAFAASKGLARHIHLYDPGRRPPGTADGANRLDWPGVARGLAASGFTGTGSVVLAPEGDVAGAARASARFLRGLRAE
jgi:sugar phosphate isomerase/epimerase